MRLQISKLFFYLCTEDSFNLKKDNILRAGDIKSEPKSLVLQVKLNQLPFHGQQSLPLKQEKKSILRTV